MVDGRSMAISLHGGGNASEGHLLGDGGLPCVLSWSLGERTAGLDGSGSNPTGHLCS